MANPHGRFDVHARTLDVSVQHWPHQDLVDTTMRTYEPRHHRPGWCDGPVVHRHPEQRALFLQHTNDTEGLAINTHRATQRVERTKRFVGGFEAQNNDRYAQSIFGRTEQPTLLDIVIANEKKVRT